MTQDTVTLIVGSDSFIGSALMAYLQSTGEPVAGTTRRYNELDISHGYLDLYKDIRGWKCPWPVNAAVICAGVTGLEACRQDPAGSFRINVEGIYSLIENLVERGVFVIYLSTNHVFDGSVPYRLPDDTTSPITEYGRQKAEVEKRISKFGNYVSIVRFTKVLGSESSILSEWRKALKNKQVIYPFSDMFMAPVPLFFAISVLDKVRLTHFSGILQVSGNRDISYADSAYRGAELLGGESSLVQPIRISSKKYSSLNCSSLRKPFAIGILPKEITSNTFLSHTLQLPIHCLPIKSIWLNKRLFYNPLYIRGSNA